MTFTEALLTALGVVVGASVSGFVAYRLGVRQRSGSVETSEAADLWLATSEMTKELQVQLAAANQRITALESKLEIRDDDYRRLMSEHTELRIAEAQCQTRLALLEAAVNSHHPMG